MNPNRTQRMPLEIKWYIIQKKQKFVRPKDIIKDVSKIFHRKITYDSIKLLYAKFLRTGSVDDLPRSGRPRALNEREERTLVRNFIAHPGTSIKSIVRNPPPNIHRVSRKTISRTLRRRGLIPKTSERGKEIVPRNKKGRIAFAKRHQLWTQEDWRRIVFSDEATLYPKRTQTYVRWGYPGRPDPPPEEPDARLISVNVWGYIKYGEPGRITRFIGTMDAIKYEKILDRYVLDAVVNPRDPENDLIFMQDGASSHTANDIQNWHQRNGINLLSWPAQSPDLNPIENVWSWLRQELWNRRAEIRNSNDVWRLTVEIFNSMSETFIRKLYDSIPERIEAVLRLKGNRTSY